MFYDMDDEGFALPDWLPTLDKGKHVPHQPRFCAMEAAAWLAGEEWSDRPRSVHPVIAQVARRANDTLTDDERQSLWPLVLASIDTSARWRPILWYRLMHYGLIMQLKYPQDPRKVWEELLKEHAYLTRRVPVSPRRVLATHLNAKDAIGASLEVVGAGTGSTSVSR
jgi:hypothetical protein